VRRAGGVGGEEGRQDNQPRTKVPYAPGRVSVHTYSTSIPPRFFYSKALMEIFSVFGGLVVNEKFASAKKKEKKKKRKKKRGCQIF